MYVVAVRPGEEVIDRISRELQKENIRSGAIVSLIGAIDACCISNMPKDDAKSDVLTEYEEPFEFMGTGEIRDGKPHIHCVLGTAGDKALAGHLHWARVENWFVHAYIMGT